MEQRHTTLKQAGRAAVYAVFKRRYHQKRRLFFAFESFSVALVIFLTTILQTYFQIYPPTYALDPIVKQLIGESRDDTAEYLKDDVKSKTYAFSVPESNEGGDDAAVHTGRVADAYEANLAKNAREGITVTEKQSQIDVSLKPTFKTYEAKKVDGDHIVYLASGGVKLIYTLKYNGLKEDIIVPDYRGDKLEYGFELSLPAGVEARLDEQGNIGIYSSDPTLFGDISFGSDEDRARVEKSREKGEKTNLVMTIPYPVIKDANGSEYTDKSEFSLNQKGQTQNKQSSDPNLPAEVAEKLKATTTRNNYELVISSNGLKDLSYPISIDPTFQVTSASDFGGLNNDSGSEVDISNGLIRRARLSGASLTSTGADWNVPTNATNLLTKKRWNQAGAVWNGRVYIAGGNAIGATPTALGDIISAPIDSNGDITANWTDVGTLTTARGLHSLEVYNGFMYVIAGNNAGQLSSVEVKRINIDGTLTNLTTQSAASSLSVGLSLFASTVYNGYLYVSGGTTSGGADDEVYIGRINADGSVSWTTSAVKLPAVRYWHKMFAYNGFLYVLSGESPASTRPTNVLYNRLKTDGTIDNTGTNWLTTSSFINGRDNASIAVYNGYVYLYGGCTSRNGSGQCISEIGTVEYAPIYTDGNLGTFRQTKSYFSSGSSYGMTGIAYNDNLYLFFGCYDLNNLSSRCDSGTEVGVYYANIKSAGWTEGWTTQTNQYATGRQMFGAVAVNGYLYVAGGCTGNCYDPGQTSNNNVEYAPINADGSLGTWTTGPTFGSAGRAGIAMTVYNGFLYVHGGFAIDGLGVHTNYNTLFYSALNPVTGAPGAWQTATNSPGTRAEHDIIGYNGYLYAFGGRNGATIVNTVSAAPLDANSGNTTAVFTATTSLPLENARSSVLLVGGRFYIFGGCQVLQGSGSYVCNNPEGNVYYATPGTNGTVGAWTTQSGGFGGDVYDYGNVGFANGVFYTHGGDGPAQSSYVRYAPLNSDGSVGSWTTTTSLLNFRADQETLAYGEYFYVIGGSTSRTIDRIPINNGGPGDVGAWTEDASPYSGSRRYHQVVAYNGYIYTMGGCFQNNCAVTGAQTGGVEYAPLNADGSVGTWAGTNGFPARDSFGAIALNGYMYVSGGSYRTGAFNTLTARTDFLYATINSDGTLGTFNSTTSLGNLPLLFADNESNTLYLNTGTSVYYAKPAGNGTVASWTLASHTMLAATYHAGYVVNKGYLYRIGGCTNGFNCDAATTRNDVEFAPVDPVTGNTTAAFKLTSPLTLRRYVTSNKAFALNGFVILPPDGGPDGLGGLSYAPILASGELGPWTKGREMPVVYPSNSYALYNGVLYVNGGVNGSNIPMGFTHYATLKSIARKGSFSKRFDFGAGVKPTKLITRGTKQSGSKVKIDYTNSIDCGATAYDNPQSVANASYGGTNAQTLTLGTSRTLARCLYLKYTIDDQNGSIFPDATNQTSISDFDLYFTANPGQRLRGGRTFTEGADRGLDAQP